MKLLSCVLSIIGLGWFLAGLTIEMRPPIEMQEVKTRDSFSGKVVGVSDGDTIRVMRDGKEVRVRLWGIDSPEGGQPFSIAAKKRMSDLVFGKSVTVDIRDTDRYGRSVGRVFLDRPTGGKVLRTDINTVMVMDGYAWWFERYAPMDKNLKAAQEDASRAKRGLWSEAGAVAPWEWRKTR